MNSEIYEKTYSMVRDYLGSEVAELFKNEYLEHLEDSEYENALKSNDNTNEANTEEDSSEMLFYSFFINFIQTYFIDLPNIKQKISDLLNQVKNDSEITEIRMNKTVLHLENLENSNYNEILNNELKQFREEVRKYEQRFD